MTAIPSLSRATTHGKRGSVGNLPAGGAARLAPPSGWAATDSIPQHPDGRHYGTMGPEWIADQIRRADGDTRPVRPMRVIPDLPHYADLRDGGLMPREPMTWREAILWGLMIGGGIVFWMFAGPVAIRAIGAAGMWLVGWL